MHNGKPKSLKANNRQRILTLLRQEPIVTAAAASRSTGISKTTVMKILDHFIAEGIVLAAGKGDSTAEGGKPPALFALNERYACAIGVHLFPEKIIAAAVDLKATVIDSMTEPVRENEKLDVVIDQLARIVKTLQKKIRFRQSRIAGIGMALPGIVDPQTGQSRLSPRFLSWGPDADITGPLKRKIGRNIPIFIDNECRFMAVAEKTLGIARDKHNIVVVNAGQGLAAGIIVNDTLKHGAHNLAGEIGHMVINPHSRSTCVCGGHGCFEVMVSMLRLLRKAEEGRANHPESAIFSVSPDTDITPDVIFQAAETGDPLAQELLDNIVFWMSIGFSNIIMMHDPEVLVIQGIYTRGGDTFLDKLNDQANRLVLKKIDKQVEIRFSPLGPEAGALGAAAYVIERYFTNYRLIRNA